MDTEVNRTTVHPGEEFSGRYDAAAIEQILHASVDDHAKNSDTVTHAPSLAEQFAGIVYFSEMAADSQRDRRSTHYRSATGVSGAETARSTRARRASVPPWRLPAINRKSKS